MSNANLFATIAELDTPMQVVAYRALANNALGRAINAIRRHLNDLDRESKFNNGIDRLTETDTRGLMQNNNGTSYASAFMSPMELAAKCVRIYAYARAEIIGKSLSSWDLPMTLDSMYDFMEKNNAGPDESFVKAVASVVKNVRVEDLNLMAKLQAEQDLEKMREQRAGVTDTFNQLMPAESDTLEDVDLDDLTIVVQYGMIVKVLTGLSKHRTNLLNRAMRFKNVTLLAEIPLAEHAFDQIKTCGKAFEQVHRDEIQEALEQGANIQTIDDVK